MTQRHDLLRIVLPRLRELGYLHATLRPTQRRGQRDEQKVGKIVARVEIARVPNFSKYPNQRSHEACSK
jgi:hypothetical protein